MVNRPQKMKNRDIRRAVAAVQSAGVAIDTIECDPTTGRIRITTTKPGVASGSGLDDWMEKHADQAEGH
jgi:hypothetical protein